MTLEQTIQSLLQQAQGTGPFQLPQTNSPPTLGTPSQEVAEPSRAVYDPNRVIEMAQNYAREQQAAELAKHGVGLGFKAHPIRTTAAALARIAGHFNEGMGTPSPWLRQVSQIEDPRYVQDTADAYLNRTVGAHRLGMDMSQEERLAQQAKTNERLVPMQLANILSEIADRQSEAKDRDFKRHLDKKEYGLKRYEAVTRRKGLKSLEGLRESQSVRNRALASRAEQYGGMSDAQLNTQQRLIRQTTNNQLMNIDRAVELGEMTEEQAERHRQDVVITESELFKNLGQPGPRDLPEEKGGKVIDFNDLPE